MDINLLIDKKTWLAPMAGYTDNAFREICKDCQADVLVSEMLSSHGLVNNEKNTLSYMQFTDWQRPIGIQLFGNNPLIMAKAAEKTLEYNPDFIDINMGCPAKKVIKKGAGIALMKDEFRAINIVKEMKKSLTGTGKFLSVKIRLGWDNESINYFDFAKKMEENGADMITLHARTRTQMFSGKVLWENFKILKNNLTIPLIANGNIKSSEEINFLYSNNYCDSVMIGRGSLGSPWIFSEVKEETPLSKEKKLAIIKKHFLLTIEKKGEGKAVQEMKKHFCFYTKNLIGGSLARQKINLSKSKEEILDIIENLYLR